MIARNEMGRYLTQALRSGRDVARAGVGHLIVTDDCSTDATKYTALNFTPFVQSSPEPMFWSDEGKARQRHLDFAARFIRPGDWVLSLDADETVSDPRRLAEFVKRVPADHDAVGLPLYEFWEPGKYRVDGKWAGMMSSRLFRWRAGGKIADKKMACGSEPTYVRDAVARGRWTQQFEVHLLHWGYMDPEDRRRKYEAYSERVGGNGHSSDHINSIIRKPVLKEYPS